MPHGARKAGTLVGHARPPRPASTQSSANEMSQTYRCPMENRPVTVAYGPFTYRCRWSPHVNDNARSDPVMPPDLHASPAGFPSSYRAHQGGQAGCCRYPTSSGRAGSKSHTAGANNQTPGCSSSHRGQDQIDRCARGNASADNSVMSRGRRASRGDFPSWYRARREGREDYCRDGAGVHVLQRHPLHPSTSVLPSAGFWFSSVGSVRAECALPTTAVGCDGLTAWAVGFRHQTDRRMSC